MSFGLGFYLIMVAKSDGMGMATLRDAVYAPKLTCSFMEAISRTTSSLDSFRFSTKDVLFTRKGYVDNHHIKGGIEDFWPIPGELQEKS